MILYLETKVVFNYNRNISNKTKKHKMQEPKMQTLKTRQKNHQNPKQNK